MAHANQVFLIKKNLHYRDNYNYIYFMVLYLPICYVQGRRCRSLRSGQDFAYIKVRVLHDGYLSDES
jgi:hypothetical protein